MYEYSKVELDSIIKFLDAIVVIDPIYSDSVKLAVKKSMNRNYKVETIENKIQNKQNLRDSLFLVDKHINNFMGIVCERIEMFNYNYLKNKEGTITLTNPDPTSKSDLLHIHDQKNFSVSSCGPDVKFGTADYVVDEYIKKHLMNEESNGFIDITGYLKAEDYCEKTGFKNLNKSQNAKVLKAIQMYGYKPTIPSEISRMEFHRIFYYYLNYLTTGKLPSETKIADLTDIITKISRNEFTATEIRAKTCVVQTTLSVSDIPDLKNEIKHATKKNTVKPAETIQPTSRVKETQPLNNKQVKTTIPSEPEPKPFQINPLPKNNLKGLKYAGIGFAALTVVGGVVIVKNPELRKKGTKYITDLWNSQANGKGFGNNAVSDTGIKLTMKTISESISISDVKQTAETISKSISISDIKQTTKAISDNTIGKNKSFNADKLSHFREALDMFKQGLITKSEFYEIAEQISKKTGKNLLRYLRLLVNFFNDMDAAELLKD